MSAVKKRSLTLFWEGYTCPYYNVQACPFRHVHTIPWPVLSPVPLGSQTLHIYIYIYITSDHLNSSREQREEYDVILDDGDSVPLMSGYGLRAVRKLADHVTISFQPHPPVGPTAGYMFTDDWFRCVCVCVCITGHYLWLHNRTLALCLWNVSWLHGRAHRRSQYFIYNQKGWDERSTNTQCF